MIQPTSPLRKKEVIQECNMVFEAQLEHYDSLRVVASSKENPYKMWHITEEAYPKLIPLLKPKNIHEPFNAPRQELPNTYWQTGYLDIVKPSNKVPSIFLFN